MKCTTTGCPSEGIRAVAWPVRTQGSIVTFVGGYCANHADDLLVDMPGAMRAVGTAIKVELEGTQV